MDDATLFLVRVWHRGQAGFRASARRVDEEQPHVFDEAEALGRYLADDSPAPSPVHRADPTTTPGDEP